MIRRYFAPTSAPSTTLSSPGSGPVRSRACSASTRRSQSGWPPRSPRSRAMRGSMPAEARSCSSWPRPPPRRSASSCGQRSRHTESGGGARWPIPLVDRARARAHWARAAERRVRRTYRARLGHDRSAGEAACGSFARHAERRCGGADPASSPCRAPTMRSPRSAPRIRNCCGRWRESRDGQAEVERLNQELAETNRGVLALYAELDEKAARTWRAPRSSSRVSCPTSATSSARRSTPSSTSRGC